MAFLFRNDVFGGSVQTEFDLIIVGGGLVGLTAANLCAQHGLSVAVVEAKKPQLEWPEHSVDIRCSAISRSSQLIFKKLGIWEELSCHASPYQSMVVWDALGFGEVQFDAAEMGEPDLGHIIENRIMLKALWERAKKNHVVIMDFAFPKSLQIEKEEALLLFEDKILKAQLIVGADGGKSWVRETTKLKTVCKSYHQHALVATIKTERPHQCTAWQRFLPEGPLAFLPLSEPNTSSIVWSSTKENIETLLGLSEESFCRSLAQGFGYRLGQVLTISERLSFPLKMLYAKQSVTDRIALIGDAAHVIHPLAGQGVNLGLSDAHCLSEILGTFKAKETTFSNEGYDIGRYLVLRKYERARKGQVLTLIAMMDFFKKTFGSKLSGIIGLRSLGLNVVNKSRYLKNKIIAQAMGI